MVSCVLDRSGTGVNENDTLGELYDNLSQAGAKELTFEDWKVQNKKGKRKAQKFLF